MNGKIILKTSLLLQNRKNIAYYFQMNAANKLPINKNCCTIFNPISESYIIFELRSMIPEL
jgi:hypothetical protein